MKVKSENFAFFSSGITKTDLIIRIDVYLFNSNGSIVPVSVPILMSSIHVLIEIL